MSNNNKSLSSEDYESMGESEKKLIEELSGFSFQNSFLQLLKKQYGDTTSKQKYISMNKNYIDHDDMALLNQQAQKYQRQLRDGSTIIIFTCTFASLVLGISMLPARRSPMRWTVGGFGVGIGLSYISWRLQLNRYDRRVNQVFRNIVKEQFI